MAYPIMSVKTEFYVIEMVDFATVKSTYFAGDGKFVAEAKSGVRYVSVEEARDDVVKHGLLEGLDGCVILYPVKVTLTGTGTEWLQRMILNPFGRGRSDND